MDRAHVLIIGGGFSGIETALGLAGSGLSCVVAERERDLGGMAARIGDCHELLRERQEAMSQCDLVDVRLETEPLRIEGTAGEFTVTMSSVASTTLEQFTHVVVAAGVEVARPAYLQAAEADPRVMMLLDGEELKSQPEKLAGIQTVLFIIGFNSYSHGYSLECGLKQARWLQTTMNVRCLIVADMLRFPHAWLPETYQQCREAGVLFASSRRPPELRFEEHGIRFRVIDEALKSKEKPAILTGLASLCIVEPEYRPRDLDTLFWSPHRLDRDDAGFYQPENLHLQPVLSGRAGIYFAGAVTGIKSLEQCRDDAAMVVRHILTPVAEHAVAIVEESKCAACLTCVRVCPHHAVTIGQTAAIARLACSGCGACVAECPARALRLEGADGTEVLPEKLSGIVVFCCEGSTYAAVSKALAQESSMAASVHLRKLPCGGNLDAVELLETFQRGAAGVLVATCHDGNCRHLHGNRKAAQRVALVRKILGEVGWDPNRIVVKQFASHMTRQVVRELRSFEQQIASKPHGA